MKSSDIRNHFLKFFESKNHKIVESSSMIVRDDPTLMFVNAGMNQFKDYFLGTSIPKDKRIVNFQKCLRVSGKHNDLEEVGIDTYHHTFFEMLGNWSFGDYFKENAIKSAWELLTDVYLIDKDKLYVTIFEGDKTQNLEVDNESFKIWNQIIEKDRIFLCSKSDNFWEMGNQGPCGPCSEIHIDLRSDKDREKVPAANLINKDHPQVIELWNLVFIQYNRKSDGTLEDLPEKHVDTGLGFERLSMVLQKKTSNYDTDIFEPIIREIEILTGNSYGVHLEIDKAIRVVADHLRAIFFAVADGQLPSNTGAGYVIRRILRRAVRYGYSFLNQKSPFIFRLVDVLYNQMKNIYTGLAGKRNLIHNVVKEEENSFLKTLDQGLILLDSMISKNVDGKIEGSKVFQLYDTYGFPKDLTALILSEKGFSFDEEEFEKSMKKQKEISKKAAFSSKGDWVIIHEDDLEEFVGYDHLTSNVKITRYRKTSSLKAGDMFQLVFNLTPFYAEGGGQVGDKGYLEATNGDLHYIIDTKKENNLIIHYCNTLPDKIDVTFKAVVDKTQRIRASSNHTATHLLHQALREILGNHVEQKGSMVNSRALRFDFSHFSKISKDQISQIEEFVNSRIKENLLFEENRNTLMEKALAEGAVALFGEKYGDTVRTVRFGKSIELCGGTHVESTSKIWHFKITSESAIAAGIRRLEAITGDSCKMFFEDQSNDLEKIKQLIKSPQNVVTAVENLQGEMYNLRNEIKNLSEAHLKSLKLELMDKVKERNGVNLLSEKLSLNPKLLKPLAFDLGKSIKNLFMLVAVTEGPKAILVCYIDKDLVEKKEFDARKIINKISKYINGTGGGQNFYSTAGGDNISGIDKAISSFNKIISS